MGGGAIGRGSGDEIAGVRPGRIDEDPRDIYWRKSTVPGQIVMRERARETSPDITLTLDVVMPDDAGDDWPARFERQVRDVASRAVAHVRRGDRVTIVTTAGQRVRAERASGTDPLLRFLALVEATRASDARAVVAAPHRRARPVLDALEPARSA